MSMHKITRQKISEVIAERIQQLIVTGILKSGDRLPSTREWAEKFEVGRSTVREALSALKAMGLVESRQGEGSFVRRIDSSDVAMPNWDHLLISREMILELIEARKALEISNASLAAEKRTESDLRAFEATLNKMENFLGDEHESEQADLGFHVVLAEATHNRIMVKLLATISEQMEAAIRETRRLQLYANKSVSKQLWTEHKAIYEAIRDQNPVEAQKQMAVHLFHVERVLFQFLQNSK